MTKKYDLGSRRFESAFIAPIKHIAILFSRKKTVINSGFSMCGGADLGIRGFEPAFIAPIKHTAILFSRKKPL
ncbi:hypothetical protein HPQ32_18960 [Photobacterium carnosum]|uniref:hypothetical protein n=1 Tax=Photobacterium carnosum TaxID=2023717 RepID=UPI001C904CFE|nr:hypothetical protein [Photobacterium carnosum]MBY3790444.1 hypothetical protein [Photobacterium carnosum]MCD9532446.1 hypothetical protein [Photobacterium carnosum]